MRVVLAFICALALSFAVSAHTGITYHYGEVADGYDYILYIPDSIETPKPLIIYLHSRSASGSNLDEVDRFGTIDAIESGMQLDAWVVAPQTPGERWDAEKLMRTVEEVMQNGDVDADRIYAIGMSMGGNGVANLAAAYPDRIAAAIILAGSAPKGKGENLSKVPLWVIRGMADRPEAIRRTDDMVDAVRSHDSSRIVYSKVKGLDHRSHERILYMPMFYDWLMSHNLQDLNRPVNTTPDLTAKMLQSAYKGLNLRDVSATRRQPRRAAGPRPRF